VGGGIVGKDDMDGDTSNIVEDEAAGIGLVVGIFFNDFAVGNSGSNFVSTDSTVEHLLNGVTGEDEAIAVLPLGGVGHVLGDWAFCLKDIGGRGDRLDLQGTLLFGRAIESALNYVVSLRLRFFDSIGLKLSREAPYAVPHVGCGRVERNTLSDPIMMHGYPTHL
jgi:hypothetical protein